MRIPIYVPLVAVAAVIGAGIYAESLHQKNETAVATAPTVAPTKATDLTRKPVQTANRAPLNPRSKMRPMNPETGKPSMALAATSPSLTQGRLVKLTGVVNSASPRAMTVERNGKPVSVHLNGPREWYSDSAETADRAAVGKTVTVYGRVRDAKPSAPIVDADAVYAPQSKRLLYSNGDNQTVINGSQTRVRFTATYQSL